MLVGFYLGLGPRKSSEESADFVKTKSLAAGWFSYDWSGPSLGLVGLSWWGWWWRRQWTYMHACSFVLSLSLSLSNHFLSIFDRLLFPRRRTQNRRHSRARKQPHRLNPYFISAQKSVETMQQSARIPDCDAWRNETPQGERNSLSTQVE